MDAGDEVDERRLAGAVRPDQADDLALVQMERDVADGADTAEVLADTFEAKDRRSCRSTLPLHLPLAALDETHGRPRRSRRSNPPGRKKIRKTMIAPRIARFQFEEVRPEHLLERDEPDGADDRSESVPAPPRRTMTGTLTVIRIEKLSVGSM